jgi:hypothetical protein
MNPRSRYEQVTNVRTPLDENVPHKAGCGNNGAGQDSGTDVSVQLVVIVRDIQPVLRSNHIGLYRATCQKYHVPTRGCQTWGLGSDCDGDRLDD